MKKILIGLVLGIAISTAGSVFAVSTQTGFKPVITPVIKAPAPLGAKKVETISATEARFQAIEKRLSALENKKK